MDRRRDVLVIVIGTGFSGLGMAIQLRKAGIRDFVLLEKADEVGGTWRDNSYPGCACDIPSHMYSFSYEQNPDWSRAFSAQPEILAYLRDVTRRHDLRQHIHFGVEVRGARWDEAAGRWEVTTAAGERYTARFLVSGMGGLHVPNVPRLPGIERFRGPAFHSARWDHGYDLAGKRVAVVGTGASAIQFVPEIAPRVARLDIYQRTPPWIIPKVDHPISARSRRLFRAVPATQRLLRTLRYWVLEARAIGFNGHPAPLKIAQRIALRHMAKQVPDPALRRRLTPDYHLGCKRVLISNDYYPTLGRPHVELVTDPIAEVTEHGIVDRAGVTREVDAIVYGTGFHVTDAFEALDIHGVGGRQLAGTWREQGIQTHLGITVAGFPNLFFLLGPNTALGHNSVVFMIESQVRYVVDAIGMVLRERAGALDVRPDVQRAFNEEIQRKLVNGIWTRGGCTSWYLDSHGVNRTIWPGFTWRYWLATRKVDRDDFALTGPAQE
jgi:cation diffusion facilitator CzcD-associated flavoprotein CzcO